MVMARSGPPGRYIAGLHAMNASDMRFFRRAGIAMMALGVVLMLGFGAMLAQVVAFRARAVTVPAVVTGLREWPRERGRPMIAPEFALTLPDGRRVTALGASSQRPCCQVGDSIWLRVDPAQPGHVEPALDDGGWGTLLIFTGLGGVFVALGALGPWIARRGKAAQQG